MLRYVTNDRRNTSQRLARLTHWHSADTSAGRRARSAA